MTFNKCFIVFLNVFEHGPANEASVFTSKVQDVSVAEMVISRHPGPATQ